MPKSSTTQTKSLYGVHPGVAMVQKWIADLKPKTGHTLDEWVALTKKEGPKDEQSRRTWLRTKHKLGTNSAWWIAERASSHLRRTSLSLQIPRPRRQSLPLQNHRSALSQARLRASQTRHQLAH
jgi:Domain of unknown function (DUF4287)